VIHGDDYFFATGPPPAYSHRPNMEHPETVDFERMIRDVDASIASVEEAMVLQLQTSVDAGTSQP
jgi:hypothetical protein